MGDREPTTHAVPRRPLRAIVGRGLALAVSTTVAALAPAVTGAQAASTLGVLMGAPQKANWDGAAAECPKAKSGDCADEISAGQFVAWPFVAEHTGTVEAIFAVLATSANTGAEIGIFANRKYSYAEITFNGEPTSSKEIWSPSRFAQYEAEIPPEDPGKLLGTSGKVPESAIKTNVWTEFKLEKPVRVVKGEKYWLTNTTFAEPQAKEVHVYQHFLHERVSSGESQPWGNYSNEPTSWNTVARPLKELPSPETTKINCEKCNTEGWLQEEPKGFAMVNPNREGQEEGGQTFSYAYGTIEEGAASGLSQGHPEFFSNGALAGGESQPVAQLIYGQLDLESTAISGGELECASLGLSSVWNSGLSTRAHGRVLAWQEGGHVPSSAHAGLSAECRGGGKASVTAESPLVPSSSTTAKHGTRSVPWNLEATCGERDGETVSIIKIGLPANAPESPATCKSEEAEEAEMRSEITAKQGCYAKAPAPAGCIGLSVSVPGLAIELYYGGTLRAKVVNGAGIGLNQSKWVLSGATSGELQCQAPAGCQALGSMTGELKAQGIQAAQLLQYR
jgi:hypothetical protein